MIDVLMNLILGSLIGIAVISWRLEWLQRKRADRLWGACNEAIEKWGYALDQWAIATDYLLKYEKEVPKLRRQLATLRARKHLNREWPDFDELSRDFIAIMGGGISTRGDDGELYYAKSVRQNITHWRRECAKGNWGNYLLFEKQVRWEKEVSERGPMRERSRETDKV